MRASLGMPCFAATQTCPYVMPAACSWGIFSAGASVCYQNHRSQSSTYVWIMALCDFGQVTSFLWASVYLSVKWDSNARFAGSREHLQSVQYHALWIAGVFHPPCTCPIPATFWAPVFRWSQWHPHQWGYHLSYRHKPPCLCTPCAKECWHLTW